MPQRTTQVEPSARKDALRALPRVDDLLSEEPVRAASPRVPHAHALAAARACIEAERQRIIAGEPARSREELASDCALRIARLARPNLRCVVNATGVIIHTNLGRAPISAQAAAHVADVASHYSTLEFDVRTGQRGSRHDLVCDMLCQLTGAEDACVVNNNASAVLMVLAELARGREVIVSRGELIEIGGSFRIPDIMELSGARMVEVGTTNKTHLEDFRRAITPETALVLKVHPSNYRVMGFHEEVDAFELAELAHEHGIAVYEDQGSGMLVDLSEAGVPNDEHTPSQSLARGVDIVSCSGDKLLGSTQAGIILGKREFVSRIKKNPFMRAMRPDKLTLAGLEATLLDYLDDGVAWERVPVLRMLRTPVDVLRVRAESVRKAVLDKLAGMGLDEALLERASGIVGVREDLSCVGGGSLPTTELPTWVVRVDGEGLDIDEMRSRMISDPERPVVTRLGHEGLICDMRTLVDERDEDDLACALANEVARVMLGGELR